MLDFTMRQTNVPWTCATYDSSRSHSPMLAKVYNPHVACASDVPTRSPHHPLAWSWWVASLHSWQCQGHTVKQIAGDHVPCMHGVGGWPKHLEACSIWSYGMHDRWSSYHHWHITKSSRQVIRRGEQSHEESITIRTSYVLSQPMKHESFFKHTAKDLKAHANVWANKFVDINLCFQLAS